MYERKMNRRQWLAAACAVAALTPTLFLTGCGGDDDDDNDLVFVTTINAAQEIPPPQGSPAAIGTGRVTVSEDGSRIIADVTTTGAFTSPVTAAHIHIITNQPLPRTGPPVFFLFRANTEGTWTGHVRREFTAADFPTGGVTGVATFADAVAQIRAGNGYINFHTTLNPPGEIRGDLTHHGQGHGLGH